MSRTSATQPALDGQVEMPQTKRERRKHVTRFELINAGRKLFARKGLYESRIEDLSRMAGIAKGTLYGYFRNKEDLIVAVERAGFQALLSFVEHSTRRPRSRRDLFRRMITAHIEFFDDNPDLVRVFHQIRGMLKFNRKECKPLRGGLEDYTRGVASIISSGQPVSPVDLEIATVLFGAISGVTSLNTALARTPRFKSKATMAEQLAAMFARYEISSRARPDTAEVKNSRPS